MLPGRRRIGRPHVLGPAELDILHRLVDESVSVTEAARRPKIGPSTVYGALAAARRPFLPIKAPNPARAPSRM